MIHTQPLEKHAPRMIDVRPHTRQVRGIQALLYRRSQAGISLNEFGEKVQVPTLSEALSRTDLRKGVSEAQPQTPQHNAG